MKICGLFLLMLLGLTACTSVDTALDNKADLRPYHRIYVQSASNDNEHLDLFLVAGLRELGLEASAGVRTMMPDNTQAVIIYEQVWNWEFGASYLYRLEVSVRDVRTEELLAHGVIVHPGVSKKSPAQMVHDLLQPLFAPKK